MKHAPATLVALPAVLVAVLIWVVAAAVGWPLVGVVPAVAAGLLVAVLLHARAPQTVLRAVGARPLARGDHPRLVNLVEGLCTTHGFREPVMHVVDSGAVNAASVGVGRPAAHLIVTSGALATLGRLELEAVVARQLCAIRRGVAYPTVLAAVSRLPGASVATASFTAVAGSFDAASDIDMEAARLTSFPPAVAAALKVAADGPDLEVPAATAHLWMVAPRREPSAVPQRSATLQRIDALSEI